MASPYTMSGNQMYGQGYYVADPYAPGQQTYAIPNVTDNTFNPYSYGAPAVTQSYTPAPAATSYAAPAQYSMPTTGSFVAAPQTYTQPSYVPPAQTYAAPTTYAA